MPDKYTVNRAPLADSWNTRRADGYDVVIIGSGYGGAITAARLATATWPGAKPSLCVLERGKEWLPGQFPDDLRLGAEALKSPLNPLGLFDFHAGADISAIVGSGLGGTSLLNANVAFEPDPEVFDDAQWPQAIRDARDAGRLAQYYDRVRATLFAAPHPNGLSLSKVKALKQGVDGITNAEFALADIAVNFEFEGTNRWGVNQRKCINCGDCVSGCNVGAKNTLDTNYLAISKFGGAHIFTQVEVKRIEKDPAGGYVIHYVRRESALGEKEEGTLNAKRMVVVSAGAIGSSEILLRSRDALGLPATTGSRFSGNGDFFGIAYDSDVRTDDVGWGAYPDSDRARRIQPSPGELLVPGPTIVGRIKYKTDRPLKKRGTVEDLSFPSMYVNSARRVFSVMIGKDTDSGDFFQEAARRGRDFILSSDIEDGALNYTLMYLVMGHDDAGGRIELDPLTGGARISWPGVGDEATFRRDNREMLDHATVLGATFIEDPLWAFSPFKTLLTVHPLGGCPMGESAATGLVNDVGQVFDGEGGVCEGLYVADGSIIPTAMGVNPFLTISALTERIAENLIGTLGGAPAVIDRI